MSGIWHRNVSICLFFSSIRTTESFEVLKETYRFSLYKPFEFELWTIFAYDFMPRPYVYVVSSISHLVFSYFFIGWILNVSSFFLATLSLLTFMVCEKIVCVSNRHVIHNLCTIDQRLQHLNTTITSIVDSFIFFSALLRPYILHWHINSFMYALNKHVLDFFTICLHFFKILLFFSTYSALCVFVSHSNSLKFIFIYVNISVFVLVFSFDGVCLVLWI